MRQLPIALTTEILACSLAAAISLASTAACAESGHLAWKMADPGTPAFLGSDGTGVNTVTVCNTSDHYRDWLNHRGSDGCQDFQHDLRAVIEVVLRNNIEDTTPLVKVNIPSRNFTGYLELFSLHPVIPSGTILHFKSAYVPSSGDPADVSLYPQPNDEPENGIDAGKEVSAKLIEYDPAKSLVVSLTSPDMHVTLLDGPHAGESGWMNSLGVVRFQLTHSETNVLLDVRLTMRKISSRVNLTTSP